MTRRGLYIHPAQVGEFATRAVFSRDADVLDGTETASYQVRPDYLFQAMANDGLLIPGYAQTRTSRGELAVLRQ